MIVAAARFKLIGFFLILLLCVAAQSQFLSLSPLGYLALGAASLLALIAITPRPRPSILEAPSLDAASGPRLWFGLILVVIGLIFVITSAVTFHNEMLIARNPDDFPWVLNTLALALLLVGGLMIVGIGRLPRPDLTVWLVLVLLAVAVFVRVYQLDQYPFGVWFDEAIYGLHARHWLTDPNFRPIFVENITFPHLLADVIGLRVLGGTNVAGLRVVSALLGSAGVLLAYLVGRRLRGVWFGLIMAFLLALLRWSIDFSRIGMVGAELPTFALLTFYFALRLIRDGRLRDAFWFGIALAAGTFGYSTYQFQALAVAIYFLLSYPFLRRDKKRTVLLGLTAVLAALVVLMPLLVYITDRSGDYFNRLNAVSIFNEDRPPDDTVWNDIAQSTLKHLQMFHLRGDRNGRHNLPYAPMLDPVTGSLMGIGLFVALRERRREHLLFLLAIILALLAGILSVAFEAPQALRSIGVVSGVIYFAALGLEGLLRLATEGLTALLRQQRIAARLAQSLALAALAFMAAWNLNLYFNLQRTNLTVWGAYSTVESLTGRTYAAAPADTQFFVSPLIGNSVPVRFLAPDAIDRSTQMIMPDPFPLRIAPTNPALIMLVPLENFYLDYLHQLYPNAQFQPIRAIDYGIDDSPNDIFFTAIRLSAQDVGAIQGLRDGQGVLDAPSDDAYTFTFAADAQLRLDNQIVTSSAPIHLAEGNHAISITPPDAPLMWQFSSAPQAAPIPRQFLYHDPVTPNGLLASFYNNADWQGTPVVQRIYPFAYWQIQILPMDRPYSVRYTGYLYTPVSGEYQMILNAIDSASLDIEGQNVVTTAQPNSDFQAAVTLEQGWHPVEVRFQDLTGNSRLFLSWTLPDSNARAPIARDYFCPALNLCATPPAAP
ncbi:MAG: hypothetical protein GC204_05270 [Chloroflexi bacterium]|nr:hypothetical protein [Chloroflexota bacterium]